MTFAGIPVAKLDVNEEAAPQDSSPKPAAHTAHVKSPQALPSVVALPAGNRPPVPGKTCAFCGTDSTPVWRSGPNKEHLCNRCGLQAARKKRKREAATLLVLKTSDPKVARQQGGSTAGASLPGHHAALGQVSARAVPSIAGAARREGATSATAGAGAVPAGLSSLSGVHLVVLPPPLPAPTSLHASDSGGQGQRPSPSPGPGAVTGSSSGGNGNGLAAPASPPAPRLVQNATLVLEESGGAAPLSHPSCLPVCLAAYDCWGQRLLASERFDVMPHLEYDPAYGCFVYDSGQEWWLLLPRAEQTEVFKALMHKFAMMKAVRMGLLPRPSLELDGAPHPAAPSAGVSSQPLRPGAPRGALAGSQGPAAAAASAAAAAAIGALHPPFLGFGPLPTLQPPPTLAVLPGVGPSAAGRSPAPAWPAPAVELETAPPAAGGAQGPDLMMALSGLLAGAGWAIQHGVVPQQRTEPPADGSDDEADGPRSGEPLLEEEQEQQEQLAGDAVAETAGRSVADGSVPVPGSTSALAGSSVLPSPPVPAAGAAATGGAAIGGEGTSAPRSPGKPPLPPGAAGTAGAAGRGMPLAVPAVGPPPGGGFASLLGAAAAGKGSLDFSDLWEPSLSGFNSRALSGLTHLLAFGPVGSTGLALGSPAAKEGSGS